MNKKLMKNQCTQVTSQSRLIFYEVEIITMVMKVMESHTHPNTVLFEVNTLVTTVWSFAYLAMLWSSVPNAVFSLTVLGLVDS